MGTSVSAIKAVMATILFAHNLFIGNSLVGLSKTHSPLCDN